ncbi:MAG TPA: STN and carboxypeptidase regulatory-like domain-containing protein [Ohtaekwangia sp.]
MLWVLFLPLVCAAEETSPTPLLEKVITISFDQEPLPAVLKKIAELGRFTFSYNSGIINTNRKITGEFRNMTVRQILDQFFEGSLEYKERKKHIILTKAQKAKDTQKVSGYIIDESTGQRLRNVSVYDPVSMSAVITDEYGYFQMSVPKPPTQEELKLVINRQNYADTTISVSPDKRSLINIKIKNTTNKIGIAADSVGKKVKRFFLATKRATQSAINIENIDDTIYRDFQFSVFPFVGSNGTLSGNVINDFSVNLLGGYSLGVQKFEMAGLFNAVRGDVEGVQLAGWINGVSGKTRGAQIAGLVNANRGYTNGLQISGISNFYWSESSTIAVTGIGNFMNKDSQGLKMAGIGNITLGTLKGPAIAGLFNFSEDDSYHANIAGLMNFVGGSISGVQLAGVMNYTHENMTGSQIAGLLNLAPDTMSGVQVGLINYARAIKGSQVGLINIADSMQGVPVGFISIVAKGGYHKLEISADEIFYSNLSFRTGVHQFYNIFTIGAKPDSFEKDSVVWTFGYGLGTSPRLSRKLFLNIDLTSNQVVKGDQIEKINLINKLYLGLEFQAARKFAIALGATLNGQVTDVAYANYPEIFTDYKPNVIYEKTYSNDINLKMWWGAKIGLRFF